MESPTLCRVPENEDQRVRALRSYEILDSEPELEFDALARVVSHTFNTPIAVVAMMDSDRLWFKSRIGLEIAQLVRKIAFCAHAITAPDQPLIVNDLSSDIRFSENPLVSHAPHLRFYAGAPLRDSNGLALGTIAVIDAQPRAFSAAQTGALRDFASLAILAMEARKRAIELKRMAMTDYLTGIANRARFDITNHVEMSNYADTGIPYSVIVIDLNDFKSVNDNFGHQAGDEVLREVATRLSKQLRSVDLIARLGGDEFGVVAPDCDYRMACALATRLASAMHTPIPLKNGQGVKVGISYGISCASDKNTSAELLLHHADAELYKNKLKPA